MKIVLTDPKGFEVGFQTGVFQPCEHHVLIENNQVYGAENVVSSFRDKNGKLNDAEWQMFLALLMSLPIGSYRDLTWKRE